MQGRSPLQLRTMTDQDLPAVDRVFRMALGTFNQLPNPMDFSGDAAVVRCRKATYPDTAFVAVEGHDVVGLNFISRWGSFGLFGPLAVDPAHWNSGIGKALLNETMARFESTGVEHSGIFTFARDSKHIELYRPYGYYPQYLHLIVGKAPVAKDDSSPAVLYSRLTETEKAGALAEIRQLTDALFPGLDLSREIEVVDRNNWGETVLLWDNDRLRAFAVCHAGAGTEAGSSILYVKFGAATDADYFAHLVTTCEALATGRGLSQVWTGVNLAREGVYNTLVNRGYRVLIPGIAMQANNRPGYNRPDVFVMDDWR